MRIRYFILCLLVTGCADGPGSRRVATLILHGGKVWTGNPASACAEALAIDADRVLAVGTDADILELDGPETRRVDLRGRLVVPGFTDAHVHFFSGGDELMASDLRSARSEEEFARRVQEVAQTLPPGTWITSGSWDHENWPGAKLPTRALLDKYAPEHPVFVSRLDGHMAVANSLALKIAGITRDTPEPEGGTIVRDRESGEPTGVLKDKAMGLVSRRVPPPTPELLLERARSALRHARKLGVTGVHDMGTSPEEFAAYEELLRRGELTTRITTYVPIASHERYREEDARETDSCPFLELRGVKAFADGSLGSSTALFLEEYAGEPGNHGLELSDLSPGGDLERRVEACVDAKLQVAIHGIGDRAVRLLLDLFERVATRRPGNHRFRIEHCQHIHPDDLERFVELGVIASMQPFHCIDDGRWAEKRIGAQRSQTTYAFRDLLDRSTTLAFGSDWPVAPLSPLLGIYAAVTRRTLDDKHPEGWIPRQKITVEEALRAYTQGSARAAGDENLLGTLEPGMLADLVVLDTDILTTSGQRIREAGVDLTVVGGQIVYERSR